MTTINKCEAKPLTKDEIYEGDRTPFDDNVSINIRITFKIFLQPFYPADETIIPSRGHSLRGM
jgi:hypothetical protein